MNEAQMHPENCFITLTYRNENLPKDKSVHKRDLQLFFKKLRRNLEPKEIRYYACGEYGDKLGRPHYHACLFNHEFSDQVLLEAATYRRFKNRFKQGEDHSLFTSKALERIWGNGFVTIGELTMQSAGYVARYCLKKVYGEMQQDHYKGKNPEFALMSRMPGIGKQWYEKYKNSIYPKDFTVVNGRRCKLPNYYDNLLKKEDEIEFDKIKEEREKKNNMIEQPKLPYAEKGLRLKTKQLNRRLHNED